MKKRERTPLNAEGGFYVEQGVCINCMAPHHAAPELLGMDEETGCYFRRQPQTSEEIEHAVEAVRVSCVEGLRYSGDDPEVLERLRARGCQAQSDVLSPDAT
jgi:hypothetical protein